MVNSEAVDALESDERIVESVRLGEVSRFAVLVQRHNRSLYRIARSIVRDEHEAEDIVQQTHVAAFVHLHQFQGRSKFSTWLARIASHEALARVQRRRRADAFANDHARGTASVAQLATPEDELSRGELLRALEAAIEALPLPYRTAFILRHVEGLDTGEAAAWLGVSEANLRVMLHRARGLLQARVLEQVRATAEELFSFGGERCARVTRYVMATVAGAGALPASMPERSRLRT